MSKEKDTSAKTGGDNKTHSAILLSLVADLRLFCAADDAAYAILPLSGHIETWPIRSKGFKRWLVRAFRQQEGKLPSAQVLADTLLAIESQAQFDFPKGTVATRIAEQGCNLYIDLANDLWEAVEVTEHGWKVLTPSPAYFNRPRGLAALPKPKRGGNLSQLRQFLNFRSEADFRLYIAWLVAAMRPKGPYPLLVLQGEQGSAKSTTARVLRSLVDPSTAPLRTAPREERDLLIAATNSWVISYDNLSGVRPWLSDALCRLATGGGFTTRELYTDKEEVIFDAQRPIIINGIDDLAVRDDLRDRTLTVFLPTIKPEDRKDERGYWRDFTEQQPYIFGALLDALSGALRHLPDMDPVQLPRMADFALLGRALEPALDWPAGSFMAAYQDNRDAVAETSIENDPVAQGVLQLVERGWREYTATEMLDELGRVISEDLRRSYEWPRTPRAFTNRLRRLAPTLRAVGMEVTLGDRQGHERRRMIRLERLGNPAPAQSASSAM